MLSRPSLVTRASGFVRRAPSSARPAQYRFLASAASPASSYQTSESNGIKIAARDAPGPTTRLAIVAKGGTRYQPLPGLTTGLEEFAFKVPTSPPKPSSVSGSRLIRRIRGAEHEQPLCAANHTRVGASRRAAAWHPHPRGHRAVGEFPKRRPPVFCGVAG